MAYFYFYTILIIIVAIIQSLALPYELVLGVRPDLLLIVSTMAAVNYGRTAGGSLGFIAGILQDWFTGGLFGIHSLSKVITGYLCGFLRDHIYQKHFLTSSVITLFATLVDQFLILVLSSLLVKIEILQYGIKTVVIPLAIWNAIIALFLYPLIYKLESLLNRRKIW
ncbi:MAG: rod shape-determining protein MreD [Bacillota bacterium]